MDQYSSCQYILVLPIYPHIVFDMIICPIYTPLTLFFCTPSLFSRLHSCFKGHVNFALLLINAGADLEMQCELESYATPLHGAVRNSQLEIVQLLLARGASPHAQISVDGQPIDEDNAGEGKGMDVLRVAEILVHCSRNPNGAPRPPPTLPLTFSTSLRPLSSTINHRCPFITIPYHSNPALFNPQVMPSTRVSMWQRPRPSPSSCRTT